MYTCRRSSKVEKKAWSQRRYTKTANEALFTRRFVPVTSLFNNWPRYSRLKRTACDARGEFLFPHRLHFFGNNETISPYRLSLASVFALWCGALKHWRFLFFSILYERTLVPETCAWIRQIIKLLRSKLNLNFYDSENHGQSASLIMFNLCLK